MTESRNDVAVGGILLALSLVWTGVVWWTIPPGSGEGDIGPRAFPLYLGVALGALALLQLFRGARASTDAVEEAPQTLSSGMNEAFLVLLHIVAYGLLMTRVGFVLATLAVVASVMIVCLRERSPLRIAIASGGVTFACWLIFKKLLGIYLVTGSWISIG